ncbi:MAG: DUF465 domain-containing protein [Pseudomonadota bacterium]
MSKATRMLLQRLDRARHHHRRLDAEVEARQRRADADAGELQRLKKRRLAERDRVMRLSSALLSAR